MIIRCNACGFVNGAADEETAFCPNCGAPYAMDNGATVMAGPPPVRGTGYDGSTPYANQPAGYTPTPYSRPSDVYPYSSKTDFGPPPPPLTVTRQKGGVGPFIGGMMVMLGLVVLGLCGLVAYAAAKAHNSTSTYQGQTSSLTTTPTASANPSATKAPIVFQQYSDPAGHFVVQYPGTWHYQAASDPGFSGTLTAFTPAEGTAKAFDIVVTPAFLTTASLEQIVTNTGGTNFVLTQKPESVTINGIHWRKVAADFTASDGASYHAVELVWHHAPGTYVIVYYAPQSQFDGTQNTVFQPMLQSFTAQ